MRRRRATGQLVATCHTRGRQPQLDLGALALVAQLIRDQNDLTLSELCRQVSEQRGVHVSVPTIYRALRPPNLPHKKS